MKEQNCISDEDFLRQAKSMITARWLARNNLAFIPDGFSVKLEELYKTKDCYKAYFVMSTLSNEIMLYMVRCYPESKALYLIEYKKTGFEQDLDR